MSFRDRFFTPTTAKAILSWRILLGIGLAIGLAFTPIGIPAAIGVGLLAYAGSVVVAMPKDTKPPRIDPFTLSEPWRQMVQGARRARGRLHETVGATPSGPLRERLDGIVGKLDEALAECWAIARRGDEIDGAVKRLDPTALRSKLETLRTQAQGGMPSDDLTAAITSVEGQLASADRLKELSAQTAGRLRLTQTRLDELVARTAEVSIGASDTDAYAHDVDDLVIEIEAMRLAVEDTPKRMILKRLGAIALAVVLIGGAWLIRDRVIDDNGGGSGDDDPPRSDREIVCVEDLRDECDALDLDIRIEDAATTLDALAALDDPSEAPIWITMAPFPEMVDNLRVGARRDPLGTDQTAIASSPITLVVLADRAAALTTACSDPLDWTCVGEAAGHAWEEIGGDPSWGLVRPAFAPIDDAIGLLGVADAVSGYFGASPIQVDEPGFVSWARPLARAVPASALTGGTTIKTIQTRPSALDIAVGAAAEMSDTSVAAVTPQYADPMIRADVVVAVPSGASVPSGLINDLARLLVTEGRWEVPVSTGPNPLPSASDMVAIREAWRVFA